MGGASKRAAAALDKSKKDIESGKTSRSQKPVTWRRKIKRK